MLKTVIPLVMVLGCWALGASESFSVCQAVRMGEELDGKVRIQGVLRKAFPKAEIFDEFIDEKCPGVEIHVVFTVASLPHAPAPIYKPNVKSILHAQRVAEKAVVDGRDLSATIVGVLYVQRKEDYIPERPLNRDVMIPPHHKWYPLILLVESVADIKEH